MTSIFLQLRKSQNVLNFCSHLFENQLRYIYQQPVSLWGRSKGIRIKSPWFKKNSKLDQAEGYNTLPSPPRSFWHTTKSYPQAVSPHPGLAHRLVLDGKPPQVWRTTEAWSWAVPSFRPSSSRHVFANSHRYHRQIALWKAKIEFAGKMY